MRFFLEIAYSGTNYHGWQIQPNAITVQEVVNKAISTLLQEEINVVGCGRTDTGVHASQYFLHFDSQQNIDEPKQFVYRLNKLLPNDVACYKCINVNDDAHARFDATFRAYHYFIHQQKDPFKVETSYYFERSLDVEKMNAASTLLTQHDDFTSFAKLHTDNKTNICEVKTAFWTQKDSTLVFEIKANRFLRNMVRSIVGTLLDVGLNNTSVEEFKAIIEAKDRSKAGMSAPANGLFLTKIEYPFLSE